MGKEWIKNLKAGERVIVRRSGIGIDTLLVCFVKKITSTGIVRVSSTMEADVLYSFDKFGNQLGRETYRIVFYFLEKYDEEEIRKNKEETKQLALARKLSDYSWKKLSLEELEKIESILQEKSNGKT